MEVCQLYNDTKFDRTYSIRSNDYSDFTHEDEGPSLPYSSGSEWHNPSKETRPAQVVISRDDHTQYAFNVQEHPICDEGFPSVHDTPLDVNGNRLPDEDIPSTYYSVSRRHDYTYYGAMPSGSEIHGSLPNGTYVTVNGLIKPNYLVKRSHEHLSESIAEVCANSKRYVQTFQRQKRSIILTWTISVSTKEPSLELNKPFLLLYQKDARLSSIPNLLHTGRTQYGRK